MTPRPVVENAAACPKCGRAWLWKTSGALAQVSGVLIREHDGRCVPPVYEPDNDEYRPRNGRGGDSPVLLHRVCAWRPCGKPFSTYAPARKCCSDSCGKARRRKLNRAANLRYWHRTKRRREIEALEVQVRAYQQRNRRAA